MYIKQWLQEPLQKRQCEMIIDQTLWELGIKPKTVERKVESMGVNDFYQQLLDYKFDEELEFRFMQCLQTLEVRTVPLYEILAVFGVQSPTVQNMMSGDGTTKKGLDHDAACIVFRILQDLVREKYATI
jgi:Ni,Fe-hydrogenase I large subunit